MNKFPPLFVILAYYLFCFALGIYLLMALSGCTITGIPITIDPVVSPGIYRPHPWLYPDSVFCEYHPDLCVGDNDL